MDNEFQKVVGYCIGGVLIVMLIAGVLQVVATYIVPITAVVAIVAGGAYTLYNLPRWQHDSMRRREAAEKEAQRIAALNAITVDEDGITNVAKRVVASLRDA